MASRRLLSDEERRAMFGIPLDADGMARCFTLSRADQELVSARRRDANRIGFAVQLALLRHPGIALAQVEQPIEPLVQWLARQLDIPATPFADYARRPQTMTDHARLLAATLGLRLPANSDLTMMVEAAAKAAWSTDRGQPITAAVVAELRGAKIILPAAGVIERAAIAGRARARRRTADALLAGVSAEQMAKLEQLLVFDASVKMTPFAWLKAMPVAPRADIYASCSTGCAGYATSACRSASLGQSTRSGCSNSCERATYRMRTNLAVMPRAGAARSWPRAFWTSRPG
jgi:hypothetical protein